MHVELVPLLGEVMKLEWCTFLGSIHLEFGLEIGLWELGGFPEENVLVDVSLDGMAVVVGEAEGPRGGCMVAERIPEKRGEDTLGMAKVCVQAVDVVAFVLGYVMFALGGDEGAETPRWTCLQESFLDQVMKDTDQGLEEVSMGNLELLASLFVDDRGLQFQELPFSETGAETVEHRVRAKHVD